jgi:hypothetical protein
MRSGMNKEIILGMRKKMVEDAQKKIIEKQKKMQQIQQTVNKSSCGCNKR